MSPGGFFVHLLITRYQQSCSTWLECCFNCNLEINQIKCFFKHAQPALVCSEKKFLQEPKVIFTKQIAIICFTGCTNNWEADVYELPVDYWKHSVAKSFRGKNNQHTLVKETVWKHSACLTLPLPTLKIDRSLFLMPLLILLHISICISSSISPWITFDITAYFIKPLDWHLVQIKWH